MTLNIAFAGSPEFSRVILNRLVDTQRHVPLAVFTQPDKATGRGRKIKPNPIKRLAQDLNIPVHQPSSMKTDDAYAIVEALKLDVLVVVAYGQILPQRILDLPRLGCLNVHASVLPRWRGAAPIERAVIAGDSTTGVAIMQMESGLDTGPVFATQELAIDSTADKTLADLEHEMAEAGAEQLIAVLDQFDRKKHPVPTPQSDSGVTYADKLTSQDREIDWSQRADQIQRRIWALRDRLPVRVSLGGVSMQLLQAQVVEQNQEDHLSQPGCVLDATKRGISVQCATDILRITQLRMEKGKGTEMTAAEALNGYRDVFVAGHRFSRTDT